MAKSTNISMHAVKNARFEQNNNQFMVEKHILLLLLRNRLVQERLSNANMLAERLITFLNSGRHPAPVINYKDFKNK